MKILVAILLLVMLAGCAKSTYLYKRGCSSEHVCDIIFELDSRNEIEGLELSLNRETGDLDVKVGSLSKTGEIAEVRGIVEALAPALDRP
jgi:hypothetical protein